MAFGGISRLARRPAFGVVARYGLAVASVATALETTLILRHYNFPAHFISHFTLIAIAITFWCAGTGPGLLAYLLSSLGVSILARNHFLLPTFKLEPFLIFYAIFSLLMGWFSASRRRAERLLIEARNNLELRVAERTGELTRANEDLQNTQEAVRRSERELRDVVNSVPAHVWRTLPEGEVDFVNDRWSQFTGLALDEALGWKWEAVLHPDDRARVVADWQTALKNAKALEYEARVRRADGEYCWWLIRNVPLHDEAGKLIKWYGTAIDIEDRKRADQALRKSEERWRSVFENSAIGVALTDLNGRFLVTNHVFQAMVGYTEEELHAVRFLDITHEDYRQPNWALITELLEGKRRQFQIEKKYRRKDGTLIWVSNNVSLVSGTERVPQFIMALTEDITERKRAEQALRRSEAYLAEAQRLTKTGSWAYNPAAEKCIYWSDEMLRIFGLDPQRRNLPDREEFLQLMHPDDRDKFNELYERSRIQKTDWNADYRIVLPDGAIKHLHVVHHPVLNESGDLVENFGTAIDVTEQVQARIELEKAFEEIKRLKDRLHDENLALREQIDEAFMFEEIVGASPALQTVLSSIVKVAPTNSTVLITGETGTGKELIARAIHKHSQRSGQAFISVNCASIPSSLIASELFGHEKGAFTGAV